MNGLPTGPEVEMKAWMWGGGLLTAELYASLPAEIKHAVLARAGAAAGLTASVGETQAQELIAAAEQAILDGTFDGSFEIDAARFHFIAGIKDETPDLEIPKDVFDPDWAYALILFDPDFKHASFAGWIPGDEVDTTGEEMPRPPERA